MRWPGSWSRARVASGPANLAIPTGEGGAGVPATDFGGRATLDIDISISVCGVLAPTVAGIAASDGLFEHPDAAALVVKHVFSAIVIMAVATTVLVPLLRAGWR